MILNLEDFPKFPADGLRIAANLATAYDTWAEAVRERDAIPSSMYWVQRNHIEYLGLKKHSRDHGTTVGPRNAETEARYNQYQADQARLANRITASAAEMSPAIRQYRALRMPIIAQRPGQILRELDLSGLLGNALMLVGTNAFAAYQLECGHRFPTGIDETEDIDFAWCAKSKIALTVTTEKQIGSPLLRALRAFDPTFSINRKKPFQAVNDAAYEVELLVAPSQLKTLSPDEAFSPVSGLIEQEWLLEGRAIRHVVITRDNKPCALFVPDPRWMALHKIWLSAQAKRNPLKREKDARQGNVLLDATRHFLSVGYPLDVDFVFGLPPELRDIFRDWCEVRRFHPDRVAGEFR